MKTKICRICHRRKAASNFYRLWYRKDGLRSECKVCHKADVSAWQKVSPKAAVNKARYKKTTKGRAAAMRYRRSASAKKARRRYNSSQLGRAAAARWRANRRSRALSVTNDLTSDQWGQILASQSRRCAACSTKFSKFVRAERDHIIPLAMGGALTASNVQALCRSCNATKGAKLAQSVAYQ